MHPAKKPNGHPAPRDAHSHTGLVHVSHEALESPSLTWTNGFTIEEMNTSSFWSTHLSHEVPTKSALGTCLHAGDRRIMAGHSFGKRVWHFCMLRSWVRQTWIRRDIPAYEGIHLVPETMPSCRVAITLLVQCESAARHRWRTSIRRRVPVAWRRGPMRAGLSRLVLRSSVEVFAKRACLVNRPRRRSWASRSPPRPRHASIRRGSPRETECAKCDNPCDSRRTKGSRSPFGSGDRQQAGSSRCLFRIPGTSPCFRRSWRCTPRAIPSFRHPTGTITRRSRIVTVGRRSQTEWPARSAPALPSADAAFGE